MNKLTYLKIMKNILLITHECMEFFVFELYTNFFRKLVCLRDYLLEIFPLSEFELTKKLDILQKNMESDISQEQDLGDIENES